MNQKLFELIYVMIVRQELKPQDAYDMLRDFFKLTEIAEREKVSDLRPGDHKWEPLDLSKWPGQIIDNPPQPYLGTLSCGDVVYESRTVPSPNITCTCSSANAATAATTACVSSAGQSIETELASEAGPFAETSQCKSSSGSSFQTVPATETAPIY